MTRFFEYLTMKTATFTFEISLAGYRRASGTTTVKLLRRTSPIDVVDYYVTVDGHMYSLPTSSPLAAFADYLGARTAVETA